MQYEAKYTATGRVAYDAVADCKVDTSYDTLD
jgi:hypothetical protein